MSSFNLQTNMYILNRFIIVIFFLLYNNVSHGQQSNTENIAGTKIFRASVVKVDITPDNSQELIGYSPRKSTGVHDHIYHRIVALDDGTIQFFLVSTEMCDLSPTEYDNVAAKIKSQLGISPMNLWWTTTHTHSVLPELEINMFLKSFYRN